MTDTAVQRTNSPTTAELKALAHATRQRILRLCRVGNLTNQELAERLKLDPATVLHHVRVLVSSGFIAADEPRRGSSGALEIPYRATGKSFAVTFAQAESDRRLPADLAGLDALRMELEEAGGDHMIQTSRLGLRLTPEETHELRDRSLALFTEFLEKDSAGGDEIGLFFVLHRA